VSRRTHNLALLPRLAAELVDLKVDVIVTSGSPYAAVAAKEASSMIPIVGAFEYDPIKYGLVTSLSRPGGNVTGMTFLTTELAGKRLSILRDLIPQSTTIAYLSVSGAPISEQLKSDMIAAGRALEREIFVSDVRSFDFKAAFATLVEQQASALIVGNFTVFSNNREKIVELAARHKIAAMYPGRQYVVEGGLMSYGAAGFGFRQLVRDYVVPILKGVKPADLPVRQPTEFAFVINLKTAKALGIKIPPMLHALATELID
jgi:putative tryptophan/tyrosine transport system substrate-binding protein